LTSCVGNAETASVEANTLNHEVFGTIGSGAFALVRVRLSSSHIACTTKKNLVTNSVVEQSENLILSGYA